MNYMGGAAHRFTRKRVGRKARQRQYFRHQRKNVRLTTIQSNELNRMELNRVRLNKRKRSPLPSLSERRPLFTPFRGEKEDDNPVHFSTERFSANSKNLRCNRIQSDVQPIRFIEEYNDMTEYGPDSQDATSIALRPEGGGPHGLPSRTEWHRQYLSFMTSSDIQDERATSKCPLRTADVTLGAMSRQIGDIESGDRTDPPIERIVHRLNRVREISQKTLDPLSKDRDALDLLRRAERIRRKIEQESVQDRSAIPPFNRRSHGLETFARDADCRFVHLGALKSNTNDDVPYLRCVDDDAWIPDVRKWIDAIKEKETREAVLQSTARVYGATGYLLIRTPL